MPEAPAPDTQPLPQGLWVLFTEAGQPAWIGPEPMDGAEELPYAIEIEGEPVVLDVAFLVSHIRTPEGAWVSRPPPPPLTEAEEAVIAGEMARQTAEADARAAEEREIEIARRAQPATLLRSMGKITIAELTARVAVIRAEVEAGN
jgi:hypothetical protein